MRSGTSAFSSPTLNVPSSRGLSAMTDIACEVSHVLVAAIFCFARLETDSEVSIVRVWEDA